MKAARASGRRSGNDLVAYLLPVFVATLFVAGGASRADVVGQVIVRAASWSIIIALLVGNRLNIQGGRSAVPRLMALSIGVVVVQLIPLPPAMWVALPERAMFLDAATIAGQPQPWRPLTLSPGFTFNALASLLVPAATMLVFYAAGARAKRLSLITLATATLLAGIWGALQFAGASLGNPFLNDVPGMVSGPFANRNHLALFLAIGCVVWPVSAIYLRARPAWWAVVYLVNILFLIVIVGTGSRAGIALAVVAYIAAAWLSRRYVEAMLSRLQKKLRVLIAISAVILVAVLVLASLQMGRAVAFDRLLALGSAEDLRFRALPTVWAMTVSYFPAGIGFGAFDPAFRIWEPDELLQLPYFNHAHNDIIEILLEGGILTAVIGAGVIAWAARAAVRAFRLPPSEERVLAGSGAAILAMVVMASIFDYPARTPLVMATIMIAALWLDAPAASTAASSGERSQPVKG